MPQPPGPWTDTLIAELRTLRAAGYNAREIAILLGHGLTRNAVIGKAWRLHIEWGSSGRSPPDPERRPVAKAIPRPSPPRPPKPPMPPPTPEPPPRIPARRLSLLELGPDMCRYPYGDPRFPDFGFCAKRTPEGQVYCNHHLQLTHAKGMRL